MYNLIENVWRRGKKPYFVSFFYPEAPVKNIKLMQYRFFTLCINLLTEVSCEFTSVKF